MDDCIFCKLVAGTLPVYKVYEDEHFFAFIDIHPQTPGQIQVIPKQHYRWVWDVPNCGAYFDVVQKIAVAQRKVFGTDWILSKVVGDEVHHAHIWVFPSNEAVGDKMDFVGNAEAVRNALG